MATAYFDSEEASKVIGYGGIFNSLSTIVFSNMAATACIYKNTKCMVCAFINAYYTCMCFIYS